MEREQAWPPNESSVCGFPAKEGLLKSACMWDLGGVRGIEAQGMCKRDRGQGRRGFLFPSRCGAQEVSLPGLADLEAPQLATAKDS
jgi:hypothetical protein